MFLLITGDYKRSPFVKYHTNQGIILFIVTIAWGIINPIFLFVPFVSAIVSAVSIFLIIVSRVLGIMNAAKGKMKPVPLVGAFTIIK